MMILLEVPLLSVIPSQLRRSATSVEPPLTHDQAPQERHAPAILINTLLQQGGVDISQTPPNCFSSFLPFEISNLKF
jgi:hypothetical protein